MDLSGEFQQLQQILKETLDKEKERLEKIIQEQKDKELMQRNYESKLLRYLAEFRRHEIPEPLSEVESCRESESVDTCEYELKLMYDVEQEAKELKEQLRKEQAERQKAPRIFADREERKRMAMVNPIANEQLN